MIYGTIISILVGISGALLLMRTLNGWLKIWIRRKAQGYGSENDRLYDDKYYEGFEKVARRGFWAIGLLALAVVIRMVSVDFWPENDRLSGSQTGLLPSDSLVTIEEVPVEEVSAEPTAGVRWILALPWAIVLFMSAGLLIIGRRYKGEGTVSSSLTTIGAIGTLSSLIGGSVTIFAVDTFNLKLSLPVSVQVGQESPLLVRYVGSVGPFLDGSVKIKRADYESSFADVRGFINTGMKTDQFSFFVVIGGADRRELRRNARAEFGSNEILARARAEVVCDSLKQLVDTAKVIIMPLTGGGRIYGIDRLGSEDLRDDRHVTVYALGNAPGRVRVAIKDTLGEP